MRPPLRSALIHSALFALTLRSQIFHRALVVPAVFTYRPVSFQLFYSELKVKRSICASHNNVREERVGKDGRKFNLSLIVHRS